MYAWLAALTLLSATLTAKDLFEVQASAGSPSPLQQFGSFNDVTSAVQDVVEAQGPFHAFENRDYVATLNYLGVRDAATLAISGNGTRADLSIPLDGRRKTFFGPDRHSLYRQIRDYLLRGAGTSILGDISKAANQQSAVALTDGNPSSTTAVLAARTFNDFGSLWTRGYDAMGANDAKGNSVSILFDGGEFRAEGHEGKTYGLPIATQFRLSDRVTLKAQIPLQYIELESASLYQAGIILDLPTRVVLTHPGQPWDWQVMPTFLCGVWLQRVSSRWRSRRRGAHQRRLVQRRQVYPDLRQLLELL
ncbi:MAG: hypothetical protein JO069_01005 [Verrucomicrobia bacterium]|nr:hypothetical protein [Verrucomicrobiota bacterium]